MAKKPQKVKKAAVKRPAKASRPRAPARAGARKAVLALGEQLGGVPQPLTRSAIEALLKDFDPKAKVAYRLTFEGGEPPKGKGAPRPRRLPPGIVVICFPTQRPVG